MSTHLCTAEVDEQEPDREKVRDRLLGAWELVSYTATAADGEVVHPLGPDPHGLIVYTPDGYMSAQLGRADRPRAGSDRLEETTKDELAQATKTYVAYAGSFEVVDPVTVAHHVTTSLFPNWTGGTQTRTVAFDGEFLNLGITTPVRLWGADRTAELIWRRPN
ncbi:lipocalin-like domain-containing protein [Streptomyces sp. NPDC046821]|uniref:lipocalin-like domain-containing protein n=1 Tax=Streptomyces sp. NPDC046821 TaxID=3154702 RepID=UPI0033CEE2BB